MGITNINNARTAFTTKLNHLWKQIIKLVVKNPISTYELYSSAQQCSSTGNCNEHQEQVTPCNRNLLSP